MFLAAFDFLVKKKKVKSQKQLAEKIGVSQNTITRIKKHEVDVSDDTIRALVNSFDGIFNMEYFRGNSVFLTNEELGDYLLHPEKYTYVFPGDEELLEKFSGQNQHGENLDVDKHESTQIDFSKYVEKSVFDAALKAKNETINVLKSQMADIRIQLAERDKRIDEKDEMILLLRRHIALLESSNNPADNYPFPIGVAESGNNNKEQAHV